MSFADSRTMLELLVVRMILQLVPGNAELAFESHKVVLNEGTIAGTCFYDCDEFPVFYEKNNCDRLDQCIFNSRGWRFRAWSLVFCNYCECSCTTNIKPKVACPRYEQSLCISITEPDLYDVTCTGTCSKSHIVRTNFHGCDVFHNCVKERSGWLRGFVRCDHCTCTCDRMWQPESNSFRDITYHYPASTTNVEVFNNILEIFAMVNFSNIPQYMTGTVTWNTASLTMVSTDSSLETGLTVTVEATAGIPDNSISASVSQTITQGYTYETSNVNKVSTGVDAVLVEATVPARPVTHATIRGMRIGGELPFSAIIVTYFKDTQMTLAQDESGLYQNIDISDNVTYNTLSLHI